MAPSGKRSTVFANLIRHLSPDEKQEFEDFLKQRLKERSKQSKLAGNEKSSEQLRLFKQLKQWAFEPFRFEDLHADFPEAKLATLVHDLTNSLKLFLACKELEGDEFTLDYLLLKRLSLRNASDAFLHFWKQTFSDLYEKGGRGGYFFTKVLELLRSHQAYLSAENSSGTTARNIFPELKTAMDQRHAFDSIRHEIMKANFERIFQGGGSKDVSDSFMDEIGATKAAADEGLALYKLLLAFLKGGDKEATFEPLRLQMAKCIKLGAFSTSEIKEVHGWVSNYLVKAFQNSGNSNDALHLFQIHRDAFENGWLKIGAAVPGTFFKSACSAGFRSAKVDEVMAFAKAIQKEVKDEDGAAFKRFFEWELAFFEGRFCDLLKMIKQLSPSEWKEIANPNLKIQMLALELKALYHLAILDGDPLQQCPRPNLPDIKDKTRKFKERVGKTKALKSYHHDSFIAWADHFQGLMSLEAQSKENQRVALIRDFIARVEAVPLMDDKWWLLDVARKRKLQEI